MEKGLHLPRRIQTWLVLAAMVGFMAWFAAYSIRLHDAHLTAKSDLGQIDLAIWNTAHGRPLQEIKDETISTRLTDHVELIFLPVSLVFWLWDDVRALLVLQAAALALGAWPIYLIAHRRFDQALNAPDMAAWGGLAFALAYLLHPALQVAAISEFHALPLAPPLIAFAFWFIERRQWGRFALAALLLSQVQEGMALLTALLGLYAAARAWRAHSPDRRRGALAGGAVALFGLAWFYVATFVIIPRYAAEVYGLASTPYAARYGALGDSFGDVVIALFTRPLDVWQIAAEPLRLRYIFGLLFPLAFLPLLAPEILLLAAPLFLANLLSSFPLQHAGELHYSAPLVPYLAVAGAVGLARLTRFLSRRRTAPWEGARAWLALPGIVVACALAWQFMAGYTPIGGEFGGWPQITAHHRLLARFAAQIPSDAPLSAATDLYPHLSHRERIYRFPVLGDANWTVVDVTGTTDMHPVALRDEINVLLGASWGVVDAADGYLLLAQGRGESEIPDAFFDFARAPDAQPQYPLDVTFGGKLRLLGYDLTHDLKWRKTQMRLYWQALEPLPADTAIEVQMLTPSGETADDTALRPMPALVWHPPARWQPGETIQTTMLPWYLPSTWAPVVAVSAGGERLAPAIAGGDAQVTPDGRARLPGWAWRNGKPAPCEAPDDVRLADARFSGDGWPVALTGFAMPRAAETGRTVPVNLRWQADGPAGADYTVFVHLRDAAGNTVAQADGTPTWFTQRPADRWPAEGFSTWDAHALALPPDLPPGDYQVVVGWYDLATGARLPLGNAIGDEHVLGVIRVNAAAPTADLCCATVPECCASLP